MPLDFTPLSGKPRLLLRAELAPLDGSTFQPTGFPDLGAAEYKTPGGTTMLLVESRQSMANRLEAVCYDEDDDKLYPALEGMPYVRVTIKGVGSDDQTTSSLLDFHRLNSPYIMSGLDDKKKPFKETLTSELGLTAAKAAEAKASDEESEEEDSTAGVVNYRKLAKVVFRYDPNSLVHGIFLEKIAGRLRTARCSPA